MIQFYGYNNGKAIAIKNQYILQQISFICSIICIFISIFAFIFRLYYFLFFWLIPLFFILCSFVVLLFKNYDTTIFLNGQKQKHRFIIENNRIYKDGKEVKLIKHIKFYVRKKFIFLELKESFYIIPNEELFCEKELLINKLNNICNDFK